MGGDDGVLKFNGQDYDLIKKELSRKDGALFRDPLFPAGDKILQKPSHSIFNRNKSIYGGREMGLKGSDIEWLRPKVWWSNSRV